MKIAGFGVEEWLNKWEKSATYDISQSTISSMTMAEAWPLMAMMARVFMTC